MRQRVLALGLTLATAIATPLLAETGGLAFQPVDPDGLDAKAAEMVVALQQGMPAQMAAFAQQGFGAYGALAVPMGVALTPELLSSVANFDTADAAREGVLKACETQTGADCTVIGLIVPAEK